MRARDQRVDMTEGELLIPGLLDLGTRTFSLALHFQMGIPWLRQAFLDAGVNGVLYASRLSGLSNAFRQPFAEDPLRFGRLIDEIEAVMQRALGTDTRPRVEHVAVSSFSAGYGAVREILKRPESFARIDALYLTDTIYADFVSPTVRAPREEQMVDFIRFGQAAARGEKIMVVSHIDYPIRDYCSTRETADALLAAVGGRRVPSGRAEAPPDLAEAGWPATSRYDVEGFHLIHFATQDHLSQLEYIGEIWRQYGIGPFAGRAPT